jgi:hypothetical protein
MPWKECHVMDERLRFVARLLEGEKMAPLCAEFGISRKTGYKIFDRSRVGRLQTASRRRHKYLPEISRSAAARSCRALRLRPASRARGARLEAAIVARSMA